MSESFEEIREIIKNKTEEVKKYYKTLNDFEKTEKYDFSKEYLSILQSEITSILNSKENVKIADVKVVKDLGKLKVSKLIEEVKIFSEQFNSKEKLAQKYAGIINKGQVSFTEDNLLKLRENNKKIQILKFEASNYVYCGETKNDDNSLPSIMDGFGFINNEKEKDYYLGDFKDDNFMKGVWYKNDSEYFIGEFEYLDKAEKCLKTNFTGLIINVHEDNFFDFLFGKIDFKTTEFHGVQISLQENKKEIIFNAGNYKEGKKNSQGFLTLKIGENSNKKIMSDYINDEIIDNTFIMDELSLIRISKNKENLKYFSEISVDKNILYRGEFTLVENPDISDKNNSELVQMFEGKGILLDFELGLKFEGELKKGLKQGEGRLIFNTTNEKNEKLTRILEGVFDNDVFTKGKVYENEQLILEHSEFDENLNLKKGKVNYPNKDFYDGNFKLNKRNGSGTYRYENQLEYHGEWNNGSRDGQGTLFLENKDKRITGEWKENKLIKIIETNLEKLN